MYLGIYHFAGDPDALVPAYDRLMSQIDVRGFDLHVCAVDDQGLAVVHGCPSEAVFRTFETSDGWRAAYTAAGLPAPIVTHHGDVHEAHLARAVPR